MGLSDRRIKRQQARQNAQHNLDKITFRATYRRQVIGMFDFVDKRGRAHLHGLKLSPISGANAVRYPLE